MKVQYSKKEDILLIGLTQKKIDDAYETNSMIVHVAKDKEPVLLEIFHGAQFLHTLGKSLPEDLKNELLHVSSA